MNRKIFLIIISLVSASVWSQPAGSNTYSSTGGKSSATTRSPQSELSPEALMYYNAQTNVPCSESQRLKVIRLPRHDIERLYYKGSNTFVIPDIPNKCLALAKQYKIKDLRGNKVWATLFVARTMKFNLSTRHPSVFRYTWSKENIASYIKFFYPKRFRPDMRFISFETYRVKSMARPKLFLKHWKTPPFVSAVNKGRLKKLMKKGFTILDIRSNKKFAADKIKGAINIPYTIATRINYESGYSLNPINIHQTWHDEFNTFTLKSSKNTPIVVYGNGTGDATAIRALVRLHGLGWRKLYWYQKGFRDWKGYAETIPKKIENIEIVSAEDVLNILKKNKKRHQKLGKKQTIRTRLIYAYRHLPPIRSIRTSLAARYNFASETRMPASDLPKKIADLMKEKDRFKLGSLRVPPKSPVVIYGAGPYDWSAYRLAIWMRDSGYKVKLYRDGFQDWLSRYKKDKPEYFNNQ